MFIFKHGSRRAAQLSTFASIARRSYASRIDIPFAGTPFPSIEKCPSPTCQCRETPPGLDIEREQSLNGSMAAYAEQVLVSTGRSDWVSRIEEDADAHFIRQMKGFIGPKGKYSDVSIAGVVRSLNDIDIPSHTTMYFLQTPPSHQLPFPHTKPSTRPAHRKYRPQTQPVHPVKIPRSSHKKLSRTRLQLPLSWYRAFNTSQAYQTPRPLLKPFSRATSYLRDYIRATIA